jgi:hypothetical protein
MQRTPGLPPELREDPRKFWSGSIVYDLPSLFGEEPTAEQAGGRGVLQGCDQSLFSDIVPSNANHDPTSDAAVSL